MLKLLFSELQYSQISLSITWLLIIIINSVLTLTGDWSSYLLSEKSGVVIWGIFTIYYLIFIQYRLQISKTQTQHRFILYKTLPLSNRDISLFRIISLMILWIIPLLLLSFFYSINQHKLFSTEWIKILGFMSIIYMYFLIGIILGDDCSQCSRSGVLKNILFFSRIYIYLLIYLMNYFFINSFNLDFSNWSYTIKQIILQYLLSEKGIELNLALGVLFLLLSIFTYKIRKSYL